MREALIFMLIFGAAILLAGLRLRFAKDPRKSVFFARVQGEHSKEEAQKIARQISLALFGVAAAIIVYCVVGLLGFTGD